MISDTSERPNSGGSRSPRDHAIPVDSSPSEMPARRIISGTCQGRLEISRSVPRQPVRRPVDSSSPEPGARTWGPRLSGPSPSKRACIACHVVMGRPERLQLFTCTDLEREIEGRGNPRLFVGGLAASARPVPLGVLGLPRHRTLPCRKTGTNSHLAPDSRRLGKGPNSPETTGNPRSLAIVAE